ncbi:MAG: O-antigen ligase family protein [Saprospiraceae bacterium]
MKQLIHKISILDIFCFFLCAYCFALCFSTYVLSVSMFGMSACIFFKDSEKGIVINQQLLTQFRKINEISSRTWCIVFFISVMISGLWSSQYGNWFHHFRLLAPFVVIPVVFSFNYKWKYSHIHLVLLVGIVSMIFQLSDVLLHYFQNYEEINLSILKGKAIPTPISHIRFSLIIACNILILAYFLLEKKVYKFSWEKWVYLFLCAYFFIGIHILAVKSGILGMYLGLFIMISLYFFKNKKMSYFLWFLPLIMGMLPLMIYLVPSLQLKYYHLLWQIGEWSRGKFRWYSDIERWQSIQFGWELIKENPLFGTGIGDIQDSMSKIYLSQLNSTDVKLPHNQFIFSWASSGIISLLILLKLLYQSLIKGFFINNILGTSLMVITWSSMLVENGLETEMGIGLFFWVFIISWLLNSRNLDQD